MGKNMSLTSSRICLKKLLFVNIKKVFPQKIRIINILLNTLKTELKYMRIHYRNLKINDVNIFISRNLG